MSISKVLDEVCKISCLALVLLKRRVKILDEIINTTPSALLTPHSCISPVNEPLTGNSG